MSSKLMPMREAISTFVKPGDTLFYSGAFNGEASAALHEIVRQGIGHLTTVSMLVFMGTSLLITEGLVDRVIVGYLQQDDKVFYPLARARKKGKFPVVEESTHHAVGVALMAGQMNVPFLPTYVMLGSDIPKYNENVTTVKCPFTGATLAAVKAIQPDVAIIHCQRADAEGNAQKWGSLGLDPEGVGASRKVIVTAEEIVDPDVIRRAPNLTILPSFRVAAVVHEPYGAYPGALAGYYNSDNRTIMPEMRTPDAFENYLREYVYGVADWAEYIEKRRKARPDFPERIKLQEPLYSVPIVTGY
jgi:glutaconate CoA-transferase, subunit A